MAGAGPRSSRNKNVDGTNQGTLVLGRGRQRLPEALGMLCDFVSAPFLHTLGNAGYTLTVGRLSRQRQGWRVPSGLSLWGSEGPEWGEPRGGHLSKGGGSLLWPRRSLPSSPWWGAQLGMEDSTTELESRDPSPQRVTRQGECQVQVQYCMGHTYLQTSYCMSI